MDILFRKMPESESDFDFTFDGLGITQCYIKSLSLSSDRARVLRKPHHHTGFEAHIIDKGSQNYEIGGECVTVSAGEMIIISPFVKHIASGESDETEKRAVSFVLREDGFLNSELSEIAPYKIAAAPKSIKTSLEIIESEREGRGSLYNQIITLKALECVLEIMRIVGVRESKQESVGELEDARVTLAKQYIKDNIRRPLTVPELASYCCISEKQLSRLFKKAEGIAAAEYIRANRIKHIEKLLANEEYSLRRISEIMDFSNEYYFNAFFKKYAGMTPGAYRRSIFKNE